MWGVGSRSSECGCAGCGFGRWFGGWGAHGAGGVSTRETAFCPVCLAIEGFESGQSPREW